jgi:hypothetical protein
MLLNMPLFDGEGFIAKKSVDESRKQYLERTWLKKARCTSDGHVYIHSFALKNLLTVAADRVLRKKTGVRARVTTVYERSCEFDDRILLYSPTGAKITLDDLEPITLYWSREVMNTYPHVTEWVARVGINCTDPKLTEEELFEHLKTGGKFVGFGHLRLEDGNKYGGFTVRRVRARKQTLGRTRASATR